MGWSVFEIAVSYWVLILIWNYGQKCSQPIRFRYSLIANISLEDLYLTDFLHVDRDGWMQKFTNGKSLLFSQEKQSIFGLKMVCPHNFGSVLKIFEKFFTMKWTKRYMEIILMVFLKKFSFGKMGHFGPKNGVTS